MLRVSVLRRSAGCPTRVQQSWETSATIVSLRWMCVRDITVTHAAHEGCVNDRPDDALHALTGLVARARRYGKDGGCIDIFGGGGRYWRLSSLIWVGPRPAATWFAMRHAVCRENASRVIDLLSRTYRVWLTRSMFASP